MALQIRNSATRWGAVAQGFHWAIVAMIIAQYTLASIAEDLPVGVAKLAALAHHKSVGITILGLAVLRLLWRLRNKPSPPLPADQKPYEPILAHLTHHGLYLLLFVLPLSGWMMSSAKNYPVSWFGWARLPNLVPVNQGLFDVLKETHEVLATTLVVLAVLHALAALQHHVLRRDDILRRMLPFTVPGTKHGRPKLALTAAAAILVSWVAFRMLQPGTTTETALIPGALQAPGEVAAPGAAVADADRGPGAAWTTDAAASTLGFDFVQAGAATEGSFGSFAAKIDFTPLPAPAGRFDVTVDMAGVDTRDKDRNEQLKSADLFDVAQFPTARYVATTFAVKDDGFEARGALTLRGVTHDVPLAFAWAPAADGKSATLKGSASLKRLDFGVGQGEWKSTEWIADEVKVTFSLRLVPAAASR
jgi:cytochrome b561/polyisoprenoid-binding protein YceI